MPATLIRRGPQKIPPVPWVIERLSISARSSGLQGNDILSEGAPSRSSAQTIRHGTRTPILSGPDAHTVGSPAGGHRRDDSALPEVNDREGLDVRAGDVSEAPVTAHGDCRGPESRVHSPDASREQTKSHLRAYVPFLNELENSPPGHRAPSVNDQVAVEALKDSKPRQRFWSRPGQHPAAGVKLASMTGALVAPFDFPNRASKMSAHSRHRNNPFLRRYDEQSVVRKERLAPHGKVFWFSNTEHGRWATSHVGNE